MYDEIVKKLKNEDDLKCSHHLTGGCFLLVSVFVFFLTKCTKRNLIGKMFGEKD